MAGFDINSIDTPEDEDFLNTLASDAPIRDVTQAPSLEPTTRASSDLGLSAVDTDDDIEFLKSLKPAATPQLNMSVQDAVSHNPDQYAEAVRLSGQTGVPTDSVLGDVDQVRNSQRIKEINADDIQDRSPETAAFLSTLDNAAQAHDDIDNLRSLEDILKTSKITQTKTEAVELALERGSVNTATLGEAIGYQMDRLISSVGSTFLPKPKGVSQAQWDKQRDNLITGRGVGGLMVAAQAADDIPADQRMQQFAEVVAAAEADGGIDHAMLVGMKYLANNPILFGVLAAEQALPMLMTAPIGGLAGGAASKTLSPLVNRIASEATKKYLTHSTRMAGVQLTTNAAMVYGAELNSGINDPKLSLEEAMDRARTKALTEGAVNAAFSYVPGLKNTSTMARKAADLGVETVKQGVAGASGAAAASAAVGDDIELSELMLEFFGEGISAPIDIATVAATEVSERAQLRQTVENLKSNTEQGKLDSIVKLAQESKLRERNAVALRDFVEQASTEDDVVYMPSKDLNEYLAQNSIDPTQDPAFQPIATAIEEALPIGADVVIPMSDFVASIAGSEHSEALREHMRLSSDTLTPSEAGRVSDTRENLAEQMLEVATQNAEEFIEAQTVYEGIRDQLVESGRATPAQAKMQAQIIPAYATVIAKEQGITVQEAFDQMGLTVEGPLTEQIADQTERAALLEQAQAEDRDVKTLKRDLFKMRGVRQLDLREDASGNVVLDGIQINKDERQEGLGTAVMTELLRWADANGKTVALTPSNSFGGSVRRLKPFYKRFGFVENKGKNKDFEISESMYRPAQQVELLAQSDNLLSQEDSTPTQARGYFDPGNVTIRLTESSDLSTFLHESGHFFLEMERKFQTERMVDINNWFKSNAAAVAAEANSKGIQKRLTDNGLDTVEITNDDVVVYVDNGTTGDADKDVVVRIATHEQFARGFETYLMEGKAPSIELREAFRSFARWLNEIYRKVRGDLKVELDNEIRQVFDRMLATTDQINQAEAFNRYAPLFDDATVAGMTSDEFTKYQERQTKATDKATETLRDKVLGQLTRQTEQWWKDELKGRTDDVQEQLKTQKVYRTADVLRNADIKLDRAQVKELLGIKAIPPSLRKMTITGSQGATPDEAAAVLGYSSGSEMLLDLTTARPIKEVAAEQAEAEMIQEHGDILNDGSLDAQAQDAVHDEKRGQLILTELRILARGANRPVIDRQVIKQLARETIGKLPLNKIRPRVYRRAEIKAAVVAQQAMDAGNNEQALQAKTRQAMNFYLWREAAAAIENGDKIQKFAARFRKTSVRTAIAKAGNSYLEKLDEILVRFEFRKSVSVKQTDQARQDIKSWVTERTQAGDNMQLSDQVMDELFTRHYREVPYDILVGVADSLKNIEHVARFANKVAVEGEKLAFQELVQKVTDHLDPLPTVHTPTRADTAEQKGITAFGRRYLAEQTKIPFLSSWLDGGKRNGLMQRLLVGRFTDAMHEEQTLWNRVAEPIMLAIRDVSKADQKRFATKLYIPEIQNAKESGLLDRIKGDPKTYNLMGHQVLAMALNTGNQENLRKMLVGEGWAEVDGEHTIDNPYLQAVLKHMTESDWKLVQMIWDNIDQLFEPMAAVHRESSGLELPRVERAEVVTPFGTFKGGYYPLKGDPFRSRRAADNDAKERDASDSMFDPMSGLQKPTVSAGATVTRTEATYPIHFDLGVLQNHMQETIHYITHYEAVRQTLKLISNHDVADAIESKVGREEFSQLKPWLADIANAGRTGTARGTIDKAMMHLRTGTTLTVMGFKASTGLMQIAGLATTVAELGPKYTARAMRTLIGMPSDPRSIRNWGVNTDAYDYVLSVSKVMPHRMKTMDREINSAFKELEGKSGTMARVREASMKHIAHIQMYMVDLPTWYAGYYKALDEAKIDMDAENFESLEAYQTAVENHAIQTGDFMVENLQGSGNIHNMAAMMRQKGAVQLFTMFMTFFSSLGNLTRDLKRGAQSGMYGPADLAARAAFLYAVPVAYEMFMRGELEDDDDDDGMAAWEKYLLNVAVYPVTSFPVVRDAVNSIASGFDFKLSPIESVLSSGLKATVSTGSAIINEDEDATLKKSLATTKLIGTLLHIPGTAQLSATTQHIVEVIEEGEELTLRELAFGPERE